MSVITGQAPINLGPLTTTFTPPPACTVAVAERRNRLADFFGVGGDRDIAFLAQECSRGKPHDATSCWPATSKGVEEKEAPLYGWGFYSPGLHCPVGYATACSATGGSEGGSDWPVQFKLRDGETAVGCCPSGYGCANINGQTLLAPMIQLNWQSSDRPASTTSSTISTTAPITSSSGSSSSASARSSPTGTITSTSSRDTTDSTETTLTSATSITETLILDDSPQTTGTETGTSDRGVDGPKGTPALQDVDDSSDGSGPLNSGMRVAIGVAASVVVLLMLVCALFYCWRRRKTLQEERELDRLCGMKHSMNDGGDFRDVYDLPGWYRGQRLATPTKDPFGRHTADAGLGTEMERPAAPYYRGYRPT
ncbi:hypothetical protein VTH06DRAFT_2383 [Thermothelomyces fergusii]